mgnify:CR=1 FL=1
MKCSAEFLESYQSMHRALRREDLEMRTIKIDEQFTLTIRLNRSLWIAFEILAEEAKGNIGWEEYIISYWEYRNLTPDQVDGFIDELIAYILDDDEIGQQEEMGYANDNLRYLPYLFKYPEWMRYSSLKREHLRG